MSPAVVLGFVARTELVSPPLALFIGAPGSCRCVREEGCCDLSGEACPDGDAAGWAVPTRTGLSRVIQGVNKANREYRVVFHLCFEQQHCSQNAERKS